MSLVGPRPVVPDELELYGEARIYYLQVRPGLTGLWQISGRNDVDYERRVSLDAWYVRNWTLWYDILILVPHPPRPPRTTAPIEHSAPREQKDCSAHGDAAERDGEAGGGQKDAEKAMAGQEQNERWTRDHVAPSRPGWIV